MIDFKFGVTWLFDKLGYIPKIKVDAGVVEAWPFPALSDDFDPRPETKPAVKKKPAAKKVIVSKASTRKTPVKKAK